MSNISKSSPRHENADPSLFNLPALPPSLSESLTSGTSIPAPPPSPPPPDGTPTTTPEKREPSLKQPVTPSAAPFASPPASMPGAFPPSPTPSPKLSPQNPPTLGRATYTASAYATSPTPLSPTTPTSKSPRRPTNFRNLLSFKRAHAASPSSLSSPASPRPSSSAGFSISSAFRPSLSGRTSGSFWTRRKSSLGVYPDGDPSTPQSPAHHANAVHHDPDQHQDPAHTPTLGKRQSMTFWRRRSSLALQVEPQGQQSPHPNGGAGQPSKPIDPAAYQEQEQEKRSWSPPPIIPDVVRQGGIGVLDPEDMFGNIG